MDSNGLLNHFCHKTYYFFMRGYMHVWFLTEKHIIYLSIDKYLYNMFFCSFRIVQSWFLEIYCSFAPKKLY